MVKGFITKVNAPSVRQPETSAIGWTSAEHPDIDGGNGIKDNSTKAHGPGGPSNKSKKICRDVIVGKEDLDSQIQDAPSACHWFKKSTEHKTMKYLIPSQRIDILYDH